MIYDALMRVLKALLLSSFFHIVLIMTMVLVAPFFERKPPQLPETIEVSLDEEKRILDALTPNENTIVRQALTPEKLKAPEDETLARFLSEKKQRVHEETQAANNGMTANRSPEKVATSQQKSEGGDEFQLDARKALAEMNALNPGFSTIGESLPKDVKIGSFTALNTDRYLYYTFYARMEESIRYRWETRVQQAINGFDRPTLGIVASNQWITHAEFLLDKNGVLQKVLLLKESGIPAFDLAAMGAFRDARIFPNPPQEMIQDDGYIHIKFSFTVQYNPPTLVNRN